jgi:prepilin-type N-terminal cleavage/methylation domain-containing protein
LKLQNQSVKGFTVLELLATVAIIGALVAIAIPAYKAYTLKARTAEAATLLSAAQVLKSLFINRTSLIHYACRRSCPRSKTSFAIMP